MADMTVNQYLTDVENAFISGDGERCAELLSCRHIHVMNPRLQIADAHAVCGRWFEQPYDELVAAHLRAIWATGNGDYVEANTAQITVVQFHKGISNTKEENWALPLMNAVTLDLRLLAIKADQVLQRVGKGKPGETLEKAAEVIMGCFRVCASDSRSSLDVSKKWGMLALINHLFKIYFKTNRLHLCKPLIRAVDSAPIKDQFKLSHQVTYRYYVGRKAMFDGDFKLAEEYLSYAFEHCHISSRKNKRLALIYLIPVKMLLGYLPEIALLHKYDLLQFVDIVQSVRMGNLLLLNETIEKYEVFFIHCGIYLILEKLKIITYRNLFKKYIILNTHQLPLDKFAQALNSMQPEDEVDIDEIQCIVANLIFSGYIKGYISHQHQKLVVSKQNAFPVITSFL